MSFQVTDGALSSTAVTHAVTITPVNDAPSLTAGGRWPTPRATPRPPSSRALALTDDSANLTGATVEITTDYTSGEDVLSATGLPSGISGSFDTTTGT